MPTAKRAKYDRIKAVNYAEQHWNSPNPRFCEFEVDCTSFVSQCLFAGGAPMHYTGRRELGWWYQGTKCTPQTKWSFSWAVAHSLYWYLRNSKQYLQAQLVNSADELKLGDVIIYDWNGDGVYTHSTIVTRIDPVNGPLVNAHTNNSRHRNWRYRDSAAWTNKTKYQFFHILDEFRI